MYWTLDKINQVAEIMQYAAGYDQAVKELRLKNIITNRDVLRQIIIKHEIPKPKIKHGGKRR